MNHPHSIRLLSLLAFILIFASACRCMNNRDCSAGNMCVDGRCLEPEGGWDDRPEAGSAAWGYERPDLVSGGYVPVELYSIVDDVPGFAAGTYGGKFGTIYEVNTLESSGPGSLKYALESEEAYWIVFQDGLNGTILLDNLIDVRSFKTVDARGHQITLKAVRAPNADPNDPGDGYYNTGLTLGRQGDRDREVRDVVFLNLTFDGSYDRFDIDGEGADAIHLQNNVHHVWIHQCTMHNWVDGAVDARIDEVDYNGPYPRNISITNSHFYNFNQGFLLEARDVTFARNFCDKVTARCVKSVNGTSHVVNNVIRDWNSRHIIYAKGDSEILVDHNILEPDERLDAGRTSDGGDFQSVHNIRYEGEQFDFEDNGTISSEFKNAARDAYGLSRLVNCDHDPVDVDCWNNLYQTVISEAGARL